MNAIITLVHGTAVQAISAANSFAITVARMAFAREHGIPPDDVALTIRYGPGSLEQPPAAVALVIINAA